jgi:hypothetical protein
MPIRAICSRCCHILPSFLSGRPCASKYPCASTPSCDLDVATVMRWGGMQRNQSVVKYGFWLGPRRQTDCGAGAARAGLRPKGLSGCSGSTRRRSHCRGLTVITRPLTPANSLVRRARFMMVIFSASRTSIWMRFAADAALEDVRIHQPDA